MPVSGISQGTLYQDCYFCGCACMITAVAVLVLATVILAQVGPFRALSVGARLGIFLGAAPVTALALAAMGCTYYCYCCCHASLPHSEGSDF